MGMQFVERFRQRSPEIAALLKDATFTRRRRSETEKALDLGGVRVRLIRLGRDTRWCRSSALVRRPRPPACDGGLFPAFDQVPHWRPSDQITLTRRDRHPLTR